MSVSAFWIIEEITSPNDSFLRQLFVLHLLHVRNVPNSTNKSFDAHLLEMLPPRTFTAPKTSASLSRESRAAPSRPKVNGTT